MSFCKDMYIHPVYGVVRQMLSRAIQTLLHIPVSGAPFLTKYSPLPAIVITRAACIRSARKHVVLPVGVRSLLGEPRRLRYIVPLYSVYCSVRARAGACVDSAISLPLAASGAAVSNDMRASTGRHVYAYKRPIIGHFRRRVSSVHCPCAKCDLPSMNSGPYVPTLK